MEAKYERMNIDQILASDITILDYEAAVSRATAPTTSVNRRSKPMTNETTKQVTEKAPKANFGQCQVVPLATSKAGATRCPRMIVSQNEYGVCGGHLAFIKRGSETRLLDGRVINPKPVEQPKTTPEVKAEPAKQDAITPVAVAVPEVTAGAAPAPKLTKKQKVQQALAILSAKQAAKNDAAVDTGMIQRSLPDAK
jgi:hypothetical protein